ncbi:MAG: hypothetical protein ACRD3T_02305 [Terriglobia bacterium]
MKNKALFPLIILATVSLGCPKRQSGLRLVYVPPAPSPAGQQSQAEPGQAMVIEEPPPPPAVQPAPAKQVEASPPPAAPIPKPKRPRTEPSPPVESEPAGELADAPPLQPSIETAETAGLRGRIDGLTARLQAEITRLRGRALPSADRKTLRDAQLFLDQAVLASKAGDLQRSLRLEKKAGLLVSAVRNR